MPRFRQDILPPPHVVAKFAPAAFLALGVTVSALAVGPLRPKKLSGAEKARLESELDRRADRLAEFLRALENVEGELEENGQLSGDTVGQIKFEMVLQRCRELEQLVPTDTTKVELMSKGFEWCGKLLGKELRIATYKTQRGEDVEYSDGSKLDRLLEHPHTLDRVASRARCPVPLEQSAALRKRVREATYVRQRQRRADLRKAFLLLLRARDTWPWVAANFVVAIGTGTLGTVALDYQATLLETFQKKRGRQNFRHVAIAWATVELCATLLAVIGSQLSARGEKVASRVLQVQLFRAVSRRELSWWEAKAESDAQSLDRLVRYAMPSEVSKVLNIPRDFLRRFAAIAAAIWRVRSRSDSALYAMIVIHWVSIFAQKGMRRLKELAQQAAYRGVVMPSQDDLTFRFALRPEFVSLYQSFARGPREARLFEQTVLDYQYLEQRMHAVGQILNPCEQVVRQGSTISQIATVGGLVQRGDITDGQARALMHHAVEITKGVEGGYNDWIGSQYKCSELAKAYDLITLTPKIDPDAGDVPSERARGHVVFENVSFDYPHRKGVVLTGASFEVKRGQVAGIVGKTGCGKSTIFRLLMRFYDVTGGRILLDGRDIREYNPEWLRSQIATVSQEPELVPLTIRDNIAMGCQHDASAEEIEHACRAANIWDMLNDKRKFPEGLLTKMRTVKNISGGEKQRICIARAVLANPPILLLDEATSALDKETENLVQEALNKLMEGRTTLVIAHRLSTICEADKIFGMKDGVIVEGGTHDELLEKADDDVTCIYGRLWREQRGDVSGVAATAPSAPGAASPLEKLAAIRSQLQEATRGRELERAKRGIVEVICELEKSGRLESEAAEAHAPPLAITTKAEEAEPDQTPSAEREAAAAQEIAPAVCAPTTEAAEVTESVLLSCSKSTSPLTSTQIPAATFAEPAAEIDAAAHALAPTPAIQEPVSAPASEPAPAATVMVAVTEAAHALAPRLVAAAGTVEAGVVVEESLAPVGREPLLA